MTTASRASYLKSRGHTLTRKQRKAMRQSAAAPSKRPGISSYKAKRTKQITDVHVDQVSGAAHYRYDDGTTETWNA